MRMIPVVMGRARGAAPSGRIRTTLGQTAPGSGAEAMRTRGPLIKLLIGSASQVDARVRSEGGAPEGAQEVTALIDTGASISAIEVSIAKQLGLLQTGAAQIGGVGGLSQQPVFAAAVHFPDPAITYDPISLVGANIGSQDFGMLIGRNILCQMVLTYDGRTGIFKLQRPQA